MSAGSSDVRPHYWAFLSYSHKDIGWGRRLHRKLERYVLPRHLTGLTTAQGVLPRRLMPVFRDRDEFPAAADLSTEVRAALERSRTLVVVCSPSAAASRWVGREVEVFRALHPDRPVLAAVIEGEPADVIPRALSQEIDGHLVEPLAADFRREGDGARNALLKLVAGIAGVNLDSLIQRDAQRRLHRVMAVTVASLLGMVVMATLAAFALNARAEANRQKMEAEGLVEFMLTDLRTTLKGVGRLDAMSAVNTRALRYYADQDLANLSPDSLERQARILHALGEDDEDRGDFAGAMSKFEQARQTTAALLQSAPNNPSRIFNQAQSEYWIGQAAFMRKRYREAFDAFKQYDSLTDRLLAIDSSEPRYLREKGYAQGNLCASYMAEPKDVKAAFTACSLALKFVERSAGHRPASQTLQMDIENRHAWLADACYANGNRACEKTHRVIQEQILQRLMRADPKNMQMKRRWITCQNTLAWIDADHGDEPSALARLAKAAALSEQLTAFDPSNRVWQEQREFIASDVAKIKKEFAERNHP